MMDFKIECTSGILAGWSMVTTGMPLDLLKTKLQLNNTITPSHLRDLMGSNGGFFRTFYSGASSMYLFLGLATALQYSVFETSYQLLKNSTKYQELQLFTSGVAAGLATSLIYTPTEFAKIRTQIQSGAQKKGSLYRMLDIIRKHKFAGIRQIYTGLNYSLLKDGPGLGLYYGGFHLLMINLFGETDREKSKLSSQIGSAFLAGLIYNIWAYPIDTFKTHIQSASGVSIHQLIQNRFWKQRSFRQGMLVSLLRGVIVDGSNLLIYQRCRNFARDIFTPQAQ